MPDSPSKPHSPEPWKQDARDRKTVLDGFARLVAVTTSREDAARIVAGVNASRGLTAEGLDEAPLSDALQVLYEICLYHSDVKFRNHVDRRAGFQSLLERAEKAWKAFGDGSFRADGAAASGEKDGATEEAPGAALTEGGAPEPAPKPEAPKKSAEPDVRKRSEPPKKSPATGSGK